MGGSAVIVESKTLRARVGGAVQKVFPNLDEWIYFRELDRGVAARNTDTSYKEMFAKYPTVPEFSLLASDAESFSFDRPTHVVVVPQEGEDFDSWAPGTRNFYYEAAQNLRELIGDKHVSVFHVHHGEPYAEWHRRLLEYLLDTQATHLITHIEADPGSKATSWTWDSLWPILATRWDGVLLGVMFDSAYRFINAKSKYLARISPRFMVVDICMPMDNSMKRGRREVGPVNMPVSRQSMTLVDKRIEGITPTFDISFIGVLYPYRVDMLEAIRSEGLTVAVNPHRTDITMNADQSRANQPSWIDYMAGLAQSRATINFSRSSAGPFEQLKTRIIEAGLAGTFLFTDDVDRTRLFWDRSSFATFRGVRDLPQVTAQWFSDPAKLDAARMMFADRSRELAHSHFWGGIERGLHARQLPSISSLLLTI